MLALSRRIVKRKLRYPSKNKKRKNKNFHKIVISLYMSLVHDISRRM